MPISNHTIPIDTLPLFPVLDKLLIELLNSLSSEEWHKPTIAKLWTVKDISSHLLDGNLRTLSISRDHYFGEPTPNIQSYRDLVNHLNQLNNTWVNATKRLSTKVLTELLVITGKQFSEHLQTLDPFATAIFPVAWAGEEKSANWLHIAREYTEKYIHQQQIREAVGKQALFTKELFYPFIQTIMYALPYHYSNLSADTGTTISIQVLTEIGGEWTIIKNNSNWVFTENNKQNPNATVHIQPEIAWKLFSKGITLEQASQHVTIIGDHHLGSFALQMVSVMA